MSQAALRLTIVVAALSVLIPAAFAEPVFRAKKRGHFGLSGNEQSFSRDQRRNWFGLGDDVRLIKDGRDARKRPVYDEGADPEISAGLGMGNMAYVPDALIAVSAPLTEPRPSGILEAAIYDALSAPDAAARLVKAEKDAIIAHYRANSFKPVWIANGALSPRAAGVLKILGAAADEGLEASNYLPSALSDFAPPSLAADPLAEARIDIGLTAMALKYARHISGGQFDPRRLSRYNDVTPETVEAEKALKVLAWSPYPEAYLASLQPRHPAYAAMKTALAQLRQEAGSQTATMLTEGQRVKPGNIDPRIMDLRARLAELGFVDPAAQSPENEIELDAALSAALKTFQKEAGLKASGSLDDQTVNALNTHGGEYNMRRLVFNMERLRWLPKQLGNRHVLVNQPAFEVEVMDGAKEIWRSRVIVGKPMSQTSAFHDEIETVVFNPSWGVPPSIIANEYLPKLRRDPSYLDREGFKVITQSGKVVPSSSVEWWSYGSKVPFSIQQPPGRKNALGEIKFLFPNSHNIYMHDTPSRNLFDEDVRAFSHGCVRLQNPREFAMVLLGWDREKVDQNVDGRKSQTVRLKAKVPVHLAYFTAWPDSSGKINYYNDLYGRDATMEKALSALTVATR